jgi:hypothetical protein
LAHDNAADHTNWQAEYHRQQATVHAQNAANHLKSAIHGPDSAARLVLMPRIVIAKQLLHAAIAGSDHLAAAAAHDLAVGIDQPAPVTSLKPKMLTG